MNRTGKGGGGARVIDGVVYDASVEAARIVAEAHVEAEQIRDRAREQGRAQGRADVAGLLVRARQHVEQRIEASEEEILALSVCIAGRIVRSDIQLRPEVVTQIVAAALADARGRHEFVLRVHPADVSLLEAERPGLIQNISGSAHLLIRADESVERGGCVVESDVGTIDARLETQLECIERALTDGR